MNENLNLVELLKNCPKGTEFYSIVYGDVYFDCIDLSRQYPVTIKTSDGGIVEVASNGLHYLEYDGECTLFPSREQRDWSKWHLPFKDGDIIFTRAKFICAKVEYEHTYISIFKEYRDNKCVVYVGKNPHDDTILYYEYKDNFVLCYNSQILEQRLATEEEQKRLFDAIKERGYRWNAEKKLLEKLSDSEFKDGDIIFTQTQGIMNKYKWVSIFKEFRDDRCVCYINLCLNNYDCHFHESNGGTLCYNYVIIEQRLATENEKQKLFDVLKSKGYKWNFENKTLEKLNVPKFKVGDVIKHKLSGLVSVVTDIDEDSNCCMIDHPHHGIIELISEEFDDYELVPKFKDGDIIFSQLKDKWVSIFKEYSNEKCGTYVDLNIEDNSYFDNTHCLCEISEIKEQRLATEEEKRQLFDAIKAKGYRWDSEKKRLEKITDVKKSRFHPKTLEPFDKVLAKQHDRMPWCVDFYSYYDEDNDYVACTGEIHYNYCIPYNEETKHLTGTVEDAPGFYRYWED